MCLDSDLFGDVVVTLHDVEIWLRNFPRYENGVRLSQVQDYIKNYDVINKIKRAKLDKSFYCLNHVFNDDKQNLSAHIKKTLKTQFKCLPILPRSMI